MQLTVTNVAMLVARNQPSNAHHSSHVAGGENEGALPHKWKGKRNNIGGEKVALER